MATMNSVKFTNKTKIIKITTTKMTNRAMKLIGLWSLKHQRIVPIMSTK